MEEIGRRVTDRHLAGFFLGDLVDHTLDELDDAVDLRIKEGSKVGAACDG